MLWVFPFFQNPLTDLTGPIGSHQTFGRCAKLEMKMMDCLEAYGMKRGKVKCDDLIEDFKECTLHAKELKRVSLMRLERHRQYYTGERKQHYAEAPASDSY